MNFKREHSARTFRFRQNTVSLYTGLYSCLAQGNPSDFFSPHHYNPWLSHTSQLPPLVAAPFPWLQAEILTLKAQEYKCLHLIHEQPHTRTGVCRHRGRQECKYVLLLIMESTLAGGGWGHKELLLRFLRLWPPFSTQLTIFRQHGLVPSFAR